ncbi:methyl-accepting chemotaxis protein [Amycolatopsis sp. NPDC051128]|uniref:methyl-accepting chemotaxis protein n=1 Tax=Amycolatopsis sp. NPDC051128 TaxID=3155412 RepID=UPI00342D869B
MAAILVTSLPLMITLAVVLTAQASSSLTAASEDHVEHVARAATQRLTLWVSDRETNVATAANALADQLDSPALAGLLTRLGKADTSYSLLEATDLTGKVLASNKAGASIDGTGQDWLRSAASGQPVVTSPLRQGDQLQWIVAQPIIGADGRVQGVVVGDLQVESLATVLVDPDEAGSEGITVVDAQRRLIFDTTSMRRVADDAGLLAAGALQTTVDNAALPASGTGTAGTTEFTEFQGRPVLGGYAIVDRLNWTIFNHIDTSEVLAPIAVQRTLAILIGIIGGILAVAVAIGLAWRTTRPIQRLTAVARRAAAGDLTAQVEPGGSSELVTLGESFNATVSTCRQLVDRVSTAGVEVNSAAAELSASSEELASTTIEQSSAITQATVTSQELAKASATIADTVDQVARQTADTRDNMERAEADIMRSSEHTITLAERVNDIDSLLVLINDIADQTNMLALNAAIEAARAGEHGLGFAVVAEEVRRLAERSKSSASDIASIVTAVQGETNATVMAMEKGAKQMQQGVSLLEAITDAHGQVRMTAQQQRGATAQVVETMGQLTDASRQVSATASQVASAAVDLVELAGTLEAAAAATGRGSR